MKKSFNHQTYKCPNHGLITGDEVHQEEIDYGILKHYCKICNEVAPYVGVRKTPKSKPTPPMVSWKKRDGPMHIEPW